MAEDIDKMDDLVEELLSYARFDYQQLPENLETHDINTWLKQLLEQNKIPTTCKISYQDQQQPIMLAFESYYMERAINNLIGNALRYAKSKVEISLTTNNESGIWIYIDDDGPGIPPQERENLFSPFVRADKSRARKTGGFGLGLAIVHKIIQWHEGKVMIEDSPLGGARLSIFLKGQEIH